MSAGGSRSDPNAATCVPQLSLGQSCNEDASVRRVADSSAPWRCALHAARYGRLLGGTGPLLMNKIVA
jgi:hypothetical protein